jgi:hypothetical protein
MLNRVTYQRRAGAGHGVQLKDQDDSVRESPEYGYDAGDESDAAKAAGRGHRDGEDETKVRYLVSSLREANA